MSAVEGFPPIVSDNAHSLILGTMPSVSSLLKHQYYGHPKNAFWPIMEALFGDQTVLNYLQRKELLMKNQVALWDVLQSCQRVGSMDAKINPASVKANDFVGLFAAHPGIKRVFFNGKVAEKLYRKNVLPNLAAHFSYLEYHCLPSTSPAFATLKFVQKLEAWKIINQSMVK
ncbi:MAG: DNA-deoxyinosine glycosylase [Methylococcales bacterium]|nr:DNA-deoxyinosine glycosylase [Methylococcales bacterium]